MSHETLKRRLGFALTLNAAIIIGEFAGGLLTHSVGLLSDSVHNTIDQGALFLSLYAIILAARPATSSKTFGYHRFGIVVSLMNACALFLTAVLIGGMAVERLIHPAPISGLWVICIALLSAGANFCIAYTLERWAAHDLNIRGAFLHMLSDAWVSMGVVVSAALIVWTGRMIFDPLISIIIVAVILRGAWPLLRESVDILLESAPALVDAAAVHKLVETIPGVENVHDLHLWQIVPTKPFLTCHVTVAEASPPDRDEILREVRKKIGEELGIWHLTVQVERGCCHAGEPHCDLNRMAASHGHG